MADRKLALTMKFAGVGNLTGVLRGIAGASGNAQDKLRGLTAEARKQRAELAELNDKIRTTSGNVTGLFEQQAALANRYAQTTRQIEVQRDAMARTAKWEAIGNQAKEKGMNNIAAGVTLGAPVIAAGKAAADFQDGMTDIQQKANLTAAETAKLRENIFQAARNAKQLPEAMRAGADFLAGAGLDPKAHPEMVSQMLAPIGKAATAYKAEINDLARASFANFDNLKVPIKDTAKALDIMAVAGKAGNFEVQDMAIAFPGLTASMQALKSTGVSAVADLSSALEIARKGAGTSEIAANNLANLLAKINAPETIKNFKKFGIDLPAAMKKAAKEGKSPIEEIIELTKKATKGDDSKLGFLFQDQQASAALRSLMANTDLYRQIRADAMKASGTVDADFALRSQNANANARALGGNLLHLAIIAGEKLLPPLVKLSERAMDITDKVAVWAGAHPRLTSLIVQTVAALALFNLGLGALRIGFGNIVGPLVQAYNAWKWLKEVGIVARGVSMAAPLLEGALGGIGVAATAFGEAMAAAGAFLLANPIILVITAIVVALAIAVPWIIKHWDAIKAGAAAFGASLAQSFAPIIQPIMAVVNFLGGVWDRIKGPLATGMHMALTAFLNFTPLGIIIKNVMPVFKWLKGLDWKGLGAFFIKSMIDGIVMMLGPLGLIFKKAAVAGFNAFRAADKAPAGLSPPATAQARQGVRGAPKLAAGIAAAATIASTSPTMATTPASPQKAPVVVQHGDTHITVHAAPGQSAHDVAAEVSRQLDKRDRDAKARTKSALRDDAE